MGRYTDIQWCDSTVNPTENCDGCELWQPKNGVRICYAGNITERHHGAGAFDEAIKLFYGRTTNASAWSDLRGRARPNKPWIPAELPRLIFVSDMSDAFSRSVSHRFLKEEIIAVANSELGRRHVWIWLTKRPSKMAHFSRLLLQEGISWPANLWAMTSVTDQATAEARIPALLEVGSDRTIRGISAEPILEPINLDEIRIPVGPFLGRGRPLMATAGMRTLDWIITGGASGVHNNPDRVHWIRDLVDWAKAWEIPCFVKQMGSGPAWVDKLAILWKDPKGGDWDEWPEPLRAREFPNPYWAWPPEQRPQMTLPMETKP